MGRDVNNEMVIGADPFFSVLLSTPNLFSGFVQHKLVFSPIFEKSGNVNIRQYPVFRFKNSEKVE